MRHLPAPETSKYTRTGRRGWGDLSYGMTQPPDRPDRAHVRRSPDRGAYDADTLYAILDATPVCHVGMGDEHGPVVIPTFHTRVDHTLLIHGATTSRLMQYLASGAPVCVAVTLIDGLVLARSVFNHSMNYRSAVVFGHGRLIDEERERLVALETITERLIPGRWADARQPSAQELKATAIAVVTIEQASAKLRSGPPQDDEADLVLPVWAGVIPCAILESPPVADPQTEQAGIEMPAYLRNRLG